MFVINDNSAKKVYIKVGISDDDYQEIVDGLTEGDKLITGPDKILRHLKDGENVDFELANSDKKGQDKEDSSPKKGE